MDKLASYIRQGKSLSFGKLSFFFGIFSLITMGLIYMALSTFFNQQSVQNFINKLPTIELESGNVKNPLEIFLQETIPDTDIVVRIDTKTDSMNSFPDKNALYLTRDYYYFVINGVPKQYPLPDIKSVISPETVRKAVPQGIRRAVLMMGIILFISLWIGYGIIYLVTQLLLWATQNKIEKSVIKRAAFVGWICVLLLGLFLLMLGYRFNFMVGLSVGTLIALIACIRST